MHLVLLVTKSPKEAVSITVKVQVSGMIGGWCHHNHIQAEEPAKRLRSRCEKLNRGLFCSSRDIDFLYVESISSEVEPRISVKKIGVVDAWRTKAKATERLEVHLIIIGTGTGFMGRDVVAVYTGPFPPGCPLESWRMGYVITYREFHPCTV